MNKNKLLGYLAGVLVYSGTLSFYQDLLGCERYIAVVRSGWISWKITVPMAIVSILIGLFIMGWRSNDQA